MDINTLYGILAAMGLSMVIMFFQSLNRKKSWKGTVTKIEKLEDTDGDGFSDVHYKIYYRTDTGKKGKVDLPDRLYESMFPNLQVGSKLIKIAGKDFPELLD
jgi:hypothetical protein